MTKAEAIAWIRGERDMCNIVDPNPRETWQERIERANAAMRESAYWVLRAHKEKLISDQGETEEGQDESRSDS